MIQKVSGAIVFLLLFFGAWSCRPAQAEDEAPHIVADYFVRYLEAERQLKAQVSFFEEGGAGQTDASKSLESGVTFQGSSMERRPMPGSGYRYTMTRTAGYEEQFRFAYRDARGAVREHIVHMSPVTLFRLSGAPSKSQGMSLTVGGGLLEKNEELILLFTDEKQRASSITIAGPQADSTFQLAGQQLSSLANGPGQLYLVKKKSLSIEGSKQTTITQVEYYTPSIDIEVLP